MIALSVGFVSLAVYRQPPHPAPNVMPPLPRTWADGQVVTAPIVAGTMPGACRAAQEMALRVHRVVLTNLLRQPQDQAIAAFAKKVTQAVNAESATP